MVCIVEGRWSENKIRLRRTTNKLVEAKRNWVKGTVLERLFRISMKRILALDQCTHDSRKGSFLPFVLLANPSTAMLLCRPNEITQNKSSASLKWSCSSYKKAWCCEAGMCITNLPMLFKRKYRLHASNRLFHATIKSAASYHVLIVNMYAALRFEQVPIESSFPFLKGKTT